MIGYYINLDRAPERRQHMESEAERLGLTLTRIDAIDGANFDPAKLAEIHPHRGLMHDLNAIEISCFMSHRRAWELIADSGDQFGAVFEDDIRFSNDAAAFLTGDGWIPDNAEMVKIETVNRKTHLSPPAMPVQSGRKLWSLASLHLGAGGYILSRDYARRLLPATQQIFHTIDFALFSKPHQAVPTRKIYQLCPAICVQQIRCSQQFLPAGARTSYVYKNNQTKKTLSATKIAREFVRPFRQLARETKNSVTALRAGGRWRKVPYRD